MTTITKKKNPETRKPGNFIVLFFTWKISAVIFIGGLALPRSQNDLTSKIW